MLEGPANHHLFERIAVDITSVFHGAMQGRLLKDSITAENVSYRFSTAAGFAYNLDCLSNLINCVNVKNGWWTDLKTGEPASRNFGELISLVHSELSEALEGARTGEQDKHLPQYKNWQVELVDALIRILDILGSQKVPTGEIMCDKLVFNMNRADHKVENRLKEDGKKF